jgi:hypothetical protein
MSDCGDTAKPTLDYAVLWDPAFTSWIQRTYGLDAETLEIHESDAVLRVLLYRDKRGRVRHPPHIPYLAVSYDAPPEDRRDVTTARWHAVAGALAEELLSRRVRGQIPLPPQVVDVRPFKWHGFACDQRYTYACRLPFAETVARNTRKKVARARRQGLFVRSGSPEEVYRCLTATSGRKGFSYDISVAALADLAELLGPDRALMSVVVGPSGEILSGGVRLLAPRATAIGWLQGTTPQGLRQHAGQLMQEEVLHAVTQLGAESYDYFGANIPAVARAKAQWGMPLVAYSVIEAPAPRAWARATLGQLKLQTVAYRKRVPRWRPLRSGRA